MTLVNAFGALALDQSVMATTPLLKAINTTLQSTPYVYVVNNTAVNPSVQNVNIANVSTPPLVQNVVLTSTPIVYAYQPAPYVVQGTVGVSNFPGIQNVNVANPSTPPPVQNVAITTTPIVSILNTNVGVNNWPSTFPTQGVVNVNLANPSTPPSSQNVVVTSTPISVVYQGNAAWNVNVTNVVSTPIVYAQITNPQAGVSVSNFPSVYPISMGSQTTPIVTVSWMPPISVAAPANQNVTIIAQTTPLITTAVITPPGMQNVNVANPSTPPLVQNVSVVSTPIVSILNTNVGVNNWPAVYQTQGIVNVNVANTSTPPAVQTVTLLSTPIIYSYQPYPYVVQGSVSVTNFPSTQNVAITSPGVLNVNLANVSTPPPTQNVDVTSTPIVYSYQGNAAWNVIVTSTPVVSILNTNIGVNNWPTVFPTQGVVNVNIANQTTPAPIQNVSVTSTPITYAYQPSPYFVQGSVAVNNFPGVLNVNLANVSTPPPTQNVAVTSTPIVYSYQGNASYNVNVANVVSTPIVKTFFDPNNMGPQGTVKTQSILAAGAQFVDAQGNLQAQNNVNIRLWSTLGGNNTTPLILAASRPIRVLSYVFTSSTAGVVILTATPVAARATSTANSDLMLINQSGLPQSLRDTYLQGGPYYVPVNGVVSFAGGLGHAFDVPATTPLYIQSTAGNVGGHLVYVFI